MEQPLLAVTAFLLLESQGGKITGDLGEGSASLLLLERTAKVILLGTLKQR